MNYVPQTWEDLPSRVTPVNAARMNHMEAGIGDASNRLDVVEAEDVVLEGDPRLTDPRPPDPHASSHYPNGADPLSLVLLGAVPTTRQIIAGTGLSGGGSFSVDRTMAVLYGTTAGTAAQGDDPRLSDERTPTAHEHNAYAVIGHTHIAVPSVTSYPSSPVEGQEVFRSDLNMRARYSGTAWVEYAAGGRTPTTAAMRHECRYYGVPVLVGGNFEDQNIPSAVDTIVRFNTTEYDTLDVERIVSGAGHKFRIKRAGLWDIRAALRWGDTANGGERGCHIGFASAPNTYRIAADGTTSLRVSSNSVATTFRFAVDDEIALWCYQSTGVGLIASTFGKGTAIQLTWVRP